jgi:CRISPR-associated protein Cst2
MAFVTGLFLIDAPAAALNNLGNIPGERDENIVGVKVISARDGMYPYVSAQAFRYWHRNTAQARVEGWQAAPIYREEKIAYTDGNPIRYWDDYLFGYMRVPSRRPSAKEQRAADSSRVGETETNDAITRASPFRVSTLVALAPVRITNDFGVMARQEGHPVPHEHQFYRTTLQGLFSLDLHACGTFSYRSKAGFRNLDPVRVDLAQQQGLEHLEEEKAYRLPLEERIRRVQGLFEGLSHLEGGAKQTLHYTDVSPVFCIMAVTRGGNHMFRYTVGADSKGLPAIKLETLRETLTTNGDELLSPIYVGWERGYLDEERMAFEQFVETYTEHSIRIHHPRNACRELIADLGGRENTHWLG